LLPALIRLPGATLPVILVNVPFLVVGRPIWIDVFPGKFRVHSFVENEVV